MYEMLSCIFYVVKYEKNSASATVALSVTSTLDRKKNANWSIQNRQFHCRLNFDLSKKNDVCQHSWKENLKIRKIDKFDC